MIRTRPARHVAWRRWRSRSDAKPGSMASVSTHCASLRCCTTSATSPCPPRFCRSRRRSRRSRRRLMRTHVDEGCQLLADIDFGAPVAEIIYEHHERFDGSGYPRGLKGEEILRRSAHPGDRRYGRSHVLAASVSCRARHGSGDRRDQSRRRHDSTTCTWSRPARAWSGSTDSRCPSDPAWRCRDGGITRCGFRSDVSDSAHSRLILRLGFPGRSTLARMPPTPLDRCGRARYVTCVGARSDCRRRTRAKPSRDGDAKPPVLVALARAHG